MEKQHVLLFLILVISAVVTAVSGCPAGWTLHNNRCYYATTIRQNYKSALLFCGKQKGTPVTFSSAAEWVFIRKLMMAGSRTNIYVGLNYNSTRRRWQWADGTPYRTTQAHWMRNREPHPTTAQVKSLYTCAYSYTYSTYAGQLNLARCTYAYPTICETSADAYDLCNEADGWKDIGGKCYKYFNTKSSWADAVSACHQANAVLPTPQSITDLYLYGDIIDCRGKSTNVWNAFTDQNSPGVYKSAETHSTMHFGAWASSYASSLSAQRGHVCLMSVSSYSFYFARESCIAEHTFVCVKNHASCPPGTRNYGSKCYKIYSTSKTSWFGALNTCKQQGMQLLTIKDQATQTQIYKLLHDHNSIHPWLAFSDRLHDNQLLWEDGTSLNGFSKWDHPTYPKLTTNKVDCGIIYPNSGKGLWINGYCYDPRNYVCEMPITQKYINQTQHASNASCSPRWVGHQNNCYLVGSGRNWTQARQYCQSLGADLTTIRDALEQTFLFPLLFSSTYIGLRRDLHTTHGDFVWVDNTPLNYTTWSPHHPLSHSQHGDCVDMRYMRSTYPSAWETYTCSVRRNFICRRPANGTNPTVGPGKTGHWSYRCGSNWIYDGMDSSCYQVIVGAKKNRQDARADCMRRGGDLVSIDGPKEQQFLQAVLSTGQYASAQDWFWIGANDLNQEGGWEWSNGAPFRYINWHPGAPSSQSATDDCAVIAPVWNYLWNDTDCSRSNNYICEKNALPESTIATGVTQPTPPGKGPCKAVPMISGLYNLPKNQGALSVLTARDPMHGPEASRITPSNQAAWSAATLNKNQYIQADFYTTIIFKGIRLAGRTDTGEYVSKFKLMYQYDYFSPWYYYQNPPGVTKELTGNQNSTHTEELFFSFAIEAKTIRLIPTAWVKGISLRWELLGCIEEDCLAEYGVSGPLFVEDGGFGASSQLDTSHTAHHSRLHPFGANFTPSCWKPKVTDTAPWLDINLGTVKIIRGVTTSGNPAANEWVTQYKLSYMTDDKSGYIVYQEPFGTDYMFSANNTNGTAVTHFVKSHFHAQHVRILPKGYYGAVALRVDILVCPITCREIPLINGPEKVRDSQLTASSALNSEHGPQRSRLNQPAQGDYAGAWEAEYTDKHQYIQVDLGRVVSVTAVATQGRDDQNQFVRSYTLAGSTDAKHWYPYFISRTIQFDGNWDSKTVRKHYLTIPMNVRYIRLWPTDWNRRISLRWELYGCPGPLSGTRIGCFADSRQNRDLPYEPLTDPAAGIWPPACIRHCYLKGYFYAGLQNGRECYCGNSYGKYGPGANCSMACFPHVLSKCGGPLTNFIYTTGLSYERICPPGWKGYEDDCYKMMSTTMLSWKDARAHCQTATLNGDLASVKDKIQQTFVYSLLTQGNADTWLGMNDLQQMMFYEWSNQRPVTFTYWNANEPSNRPGMHEDCVIMKYQTGGWQDETCSDQHYFMCMAPKTPTNIPTLPPKIQGCQNGWTAYRWSCYLFVQQVRTWSAASRACQAFGATLVRIDDRFEQAYVASVLGRNKGMFWTDASIFNFTSPYMYSDGHTSVPVTNWAKNKPDQNGKCVSVGTGSNAGLWYNSACNSTYSAICEKQRTGYTTPATPSPPPTLAACPQGWIDTGGQYCYQVNNQTMNKQLSWEIAQHDCRMQNAHLASFHFPSEFDKLWRNYLIGSNDHYWIGLNILDNGGRLGYQWTDFSSTGFIPWGPNEPNNQGGEEKCVECIIETGLFNDNKCSELRNWICGVKRGRQVRQKTTIPVPSAGKPGSCSPLPDTWKFYNGNCYLVQTGIGSNALSWRDARKACQNYTGGDLTTVLDISEQVFVQSLIQKVPDLHVWIGLNELDWEYGYRWSTGRLASFLYWNKHQPDDHGGSESCVDMSINNGKWNDEHCSITQGYVCKKPAHNVVTPSVTPAPKRTGNCPRGFHAFGNRCFQIHTGAAVNFAKAQKMCHGSGWGYDLATVLNPREQAFIITLLNNVRMSLWIGLTKTPAQGGGQNLRWAFNNDVSTYSNFDSAEPNGGMNEACVQMYSDGNHVGKWNDISCESGSGYICEAWRQPHSPSPPPVPNLCSSYPGSSPMGDACFKLTPTPMKWNDSQNFCKSQGANLASIEDIYEQSVVYLLASQNSSTQSVWIGLNDIQHKGKYIWSDTWPLLFTQWGANEPSRGPGEGCVVLDPTTGTWADTNCSLSLPSICKKTKDKPTFIPPVPNGQCVGDEWTSFGSQCFRFHGNRILKFSDAVFQCEEERGHLVSLHDNATNAFIKTFVSKQTSLNIWLGLYKSTDAGFAWRDSSPLGYTNWDAHQPSKTSPDGTQEHCVEMFVGTGKWNDVSCSSSRGFICQRPQVHDTKLQTFPTLPSPGTMPTPKPVTLPQQQTPTPFTNVSPSKKQSPNTSTWAKTSPPSSKTSPPSSKTSPSKKTTVTSTQGNLPQSSPGSLHGTQAPALGGGGVAAIVLGVFIIIAIAVGITIFIMQRRRVSGFSLYEHGTGFGNRLYDKNATEESAPM